jgi:ABC-type methionine transport system ATPase subunit
MNNHANSSKTRIRIRIPKQYHQTPIISQIISQYKVEVVVLGAILGANAEGDGWFDLELQGDLENIFNALRYLESLSIEFLHDIETGIYFE